MSVLEAQWQNKSSIVFVTSPLSLYQSPLYKKTRRLRRFFQPFSLGRSTNNMAHDKIGKRRGAERCTKPVSSVYSAQPFFISRCVPTKWTPGRGYQLLGDYFLFSVPLKLTVGNQIQRNLKSQSNQNNTPIRPINEHTQRAPSAEKRHGYDWLNK